MSTTGWQEVLAYWFGDDVAKGSWRERTAIWFSGDAAIDREIENRFGALLAKARSGLLEDWLREPRSRLALIILLDQFSRNIYRGTAQAFASDQRALEIALATCDAGLDVALHPVERAFLYMPTMHSEDLAVQERGVALFEALVDSAGDTVGYVRENLRFAREHRDLIARFGRFPHRNQVLGREPTEDEQSFLAGGGATYGQVTKQN